MQSEPIDSRKPIAPLSEEPFQAPAEPNCFLPSNSNTEYDEKVNAIWNAVQANCRQLYHDLKSKK